MSLYSQNLVSVAVCNYNYAKYLSEAIDSVMHQSYEDIQIVVVDDGSTDESREILESYDDPRLEVIYQANSGQASAFNAALEKCRGDLVAFLDSDDFWYGDKLERAIPAFADNRICAVQHNLHVVDASSAPTGEVNPDFPPGRKTIKNSYFKRHHTGFFAPTSGIVCRKSVLRKIFPLDEQWQICADVAFTRPLPIFGDIMTLGHILGAYRVHGSNFWSGSDQSKKWLENQSRYVSYTNDWLSRCGQDQQIVLEKSYRYHFHRAECGLPVSLKIRGIIWTRKFVADRTWLRKVARYLRRKLR